MSVSAHLGPLRVGVQKAVSHLSQNNSQAIDGLCQLADDLLVGGPLNALRQVRDLREKIPHLMHPVVKDDKKKVHEVVTEAIAKIGENISIRRFTRYQVGEGIEKKKEDLAAEVAKTIGQTGGKP